MMRQAFIGAVIITLLVIGGYLLWQNSAQNAFQPEQTAEIEGLLLEIDGLKQERQQLLEQREELIGKLDDVRNQREQLKQQLR